MELKVIFNENKHKFLKTSLDYPEDYTFIKRIFIRAIMIIITFIMLRFCDSNDSYIYKKTNNQIR